MKSLARRRRLVLVVLQTAIVAVFLLCWEFLPKIEQVRNLGAFFDPFFISSPSEVARTLAELVAGSNGRVLIWPFVWQTVSSSLLGVLVGVVAGGLFGLVLSNSRFLSDLLQPLVVAVNAIPRIALIPIIVIIFGPTFRASVATAVMVVFFVAFYNAYEGGRTVSQTMLRNAEILGASKFQVARHIRLPYAFAWIMATLPLATTFALLSVVTGEILTGTPGLGKLITQALVFSDSGLTFAVVVVLSIVGITVTTAASKVRRIVLHWWESNLT